MAEFDAIRSTKSGQQALQFAYNEQAKAVDVAIINGEVPVRFDYIEYVFDNQDRVIVANYFINGTRSSATAQTIPDVSGSLQNKFFTLSDANNLNKYDVAYSQNGTTPSTPNTIVPVTYVANDSDEEIAIKTALALQSVEDIFVEQSGNILTFTNFRVGISDNIMDGDGSNGTLFGLAQIQTGTDGTIRAKKFQDWIGTTNCVSKLEWVVFQ